MTTGGIGGKSGSMARMLAFADVAAAPRVRTSSSDDAVPRAGQVRWIGLRPARDVPMRAVESAEAVAGKGLRGDRYASASGKRGITLIQAERALRLPRWLELDVVEIAALRRNLMVSGIPLIALKGRRFTSAMCSAKAPPPATRVRGWKPRCIPRAGTTRCAATAACARGFCKVAPSASTMRSPDRGLSLKLRGHCILSHGFESGPDATKVTALADVAKRFGWTHERPDYSDLDARRDIGPLGDVPQRLLRLRAGAIGRGMRSAGDGRLQSRRSFRADFARTVQGRHAGEGAVPDGAAADHGAIPGAGCAAGLHFPSSTAGTMS